MQYLSKELMNYASYIFSNPFRLQFLSTSVVADPGLVGFGLFGSPRSGSGTKSDPDPDP